MKIAGRTFVISGAASGLGRACAVDIAAHGGAVAVLDMDADQGKALVSHLGATSASFFLCNVTDTSSIAAAVKGAVAWAKETGKPLGGIIPAAGVGLPGLILDGKMRPLALQSIDFVLSINLRGTLDLVRQLLPHLAAVEPEDADGERGVIVMIASSAAFEGQMGQVAYAASKGAVAAMTLPMARDLARHGLRVVTIAPSMFETNMAKGMSEKVREGLSKSFEFPRRAGKPEEFAELVRGCIGNKMLNGTVVRLDGGSRMPSRL